MSHSTGWERSSSRGYEAAEAAPDEVVAGELSSNPNVLGVGVTKRDGAYVVRVNLVNPDGSIPSEVMGIPVITEVIGEVRAVEHLAAEVRRYEQFYGVPSESMRDVFTTEEVESAEFRRWSRLHRTLEYACARSGTDKSQREAQVDRLRSFMSRVRDIRSRVGTAAAVLRGRPVVYRISLPYDAWFIQGPHVRMRDVRVQRPVAADGIEAAVAAS